MAYKRQRLFVSKKGCFLDSLLRKTHIPPDLVVAEGVPDGESSSHRDFLFLHDVETTSNQLSSHKITSAISRAWVFLPRNPVESGILRWVWHSMTPSSTVSMHCSLARRLVWYARVMTPGHWAIAYLLAYPPTLARAPRRDTHRRSSPPSGTDCHAPPGPSRSRDNTSARTGVRLPP